MKLQANESINGKSSAWKPNNKSMKRTFSQKQKHISRGKGKIFSIGTSSTKSGQRFEEREDGRTWYSLISDLSKPGMKRVMDLLAGSNFTDDILLLWLAGRERRFFASLPTVLSMISFQLRGKPTWTCGMKAKGKGKKFCLTLSTDSSSKCGGAIPNAPDTCAPAWIAQPQ
ncbi:hypothetical protein CFP56_026013 [Quercus suber]|uniref:Uncharacterized protein n=1 Tax=Quercus suber TaxID=58331 RepID=A0AAW0K2E8_QUESU